MAEAAVTFLLEKVTETLKGYKDLISGSKNELEKLKDELSLLKAILKDAAVSKVKKDATFIEVERQIKEVVYEVEDTVDACLTEAAAEKAKNAVVRLFYQHPLRLADKVKTLREEHVKPALERAGAFGTIGSFHAPRATDEEQPVKMKKDQTIRQDKVIGFEDEEKTIITYMMEAKEELEVMTIVGMAGNGKTTLAWKIFQNKEITEQFPTRIWIYVSEEFNNRDMFLNILKKFTNQDASALNDQNLVQTVRTCLEKERFLLVLDNVWGADVWNSIKDVLPRANNNGKVLITTRERDIAARAHARVHELRFLSEKESWELLLLEVFNDPKSCPPELEGIGRLIAEKCYGVPLTIVVIGGILRDLMGKSRTTNVVHKEWENVSENLDKLLQEPDKVELLLVSVGLSYNRLADSLKECFLYMGVFPSGHQIPIRTLIRLWIAEGFVVPLNGKSLEETAEEYLEDLITRNLLMVDKTNQLGEVKTCRVHDIIRAFCISKAAEQNLFKEMSMTKEGTFYPPVSKMDSLNRICLHSSLNLFLSEQPKSPRVRSFLCFSKLPVQVEEKHISTIPDGFKLLRVLDSKSIKFHEFPTKVIKLIHLRYVTLSIDNLALIPKPISQLWNLQTLIIDTKLPSITMEANIWKMIWLRHLKTKAAIILNPNWQGKGGDNLQTLTTLSPQSCTPAVFERARNLKTLKIRGELAALFKNMSLEKLGRLDKLKIVNDLIHALANEDRLQGLPPPNCFPPNLKRLTLSNTFLDWKHMSSLAKIETLEVLKLKDNAFTGISWNAIGDGFPDLRFLVVENADLLHWHATSSHFPSLTCLVLKRCESLQEIPKCMSEAKHLVRLEIEHLRKSAVESAREIEAGKRIKEDVRFKLSIGPGCESSPVAQA